MVTVALLGTGLLGSAIASRLLAVVVRFGSGTGIQSVVNR